MIHFKLLDQLRSLHSVPLMKWNPQPFESESKNFDLVHLPFTVPFDSEYDVTPLFDEGVEVWLLEWDLETRLFISQEWAKSETRTLRLFCRKQYLFVSRGYGIVSFPWVLNEIQLSATSLHEGYASLLQELSVPTEKDEDDEERKPFDCFLDLSVQVRQDQFREVEMKATFEESRRCKPKKYIAYKRTNYLKVLLNQILCYQPFKLREEYYKTQNQLLESLCDNNRGWNFDDPHLPLYIRRFYQNKKLYKFYPYVFHICREIGGKAMHVSTSEYREILKHFQKIEKVWNEKPPRHNFPYFQLIIEKIVWKLGVEWPYRLIHLKNTLKQIKLEMYLDEIIKRI